MNIKNKLGTLAIITAPNLNYDKFDITVSLFTEEKLDLIKSKKIFERIHPIYLNCKNCDVCILLGDEEIIGINKYWKIYFNNNVYWISKEWIEIVR